MNAIVTISKVALEEPRWDSWSQSNTQTNTEKYAQHRCIFCPCINHTHTHTHTLSLCSGPRWLFRVSTVVGDICSAFVCECHNQIAMPFTQCIFPFLMLTKVSCTKIVLVLHNILTMLTSQGLDVIIYCHSKVGGQ